MPFIYPFNPDRKIYSSSEVSINTGNSLSRISENLVPMGESRRSAVAYKKTLLGTVPTEPEDAVIKRDPQKITIEIKFNMRHIYIEIKAIDKDTLQVEMKGKGKFCGDLSVENNTIKIISKDQKKKVVLEIMSDKSIKITNDCFEPSAYIILQKIKTA